MSEKIIPVTKAQAQHLLALDHEHTVALEKFQAAVATLFLGHGVVSAQVQRIDPEKGEMVLADVKEG